MARVNVEDCVLNVPNRFELVILAAQRAKQIAAGNPITLPRDNDKDAVVSLREIADKTIDLGNIHEDVVQSFCKRQQAEHLQKEIAAYTDDTASETKAMTDEISAAFEDAKQHIGGDKGKGGISFVEDNIDADD